MLQRHGTVAFKLKPGSIVTAAEQDLRIRQNKKADIDEPGRPYAFVCAHVRKAKNAAELIELALAHPEKGVDSGKYNTRLIYGDPDLLRAALSLAQAKSVVLEAAE
jgi:rhodanese-related sulfurtransferase